MYDFPVELQDAYTPSGRRINKKKAVVRTDDGLPLSIVSDKYCLITHKEVIDPLKDIFNSIGKYKEKVDLTKEGAVLHYTAEFLDRKVALNVGDVCGMRIHVKNSYDGLGSTNIRIGSVVLSCTNGMVRDSNKFNDIRVRHIGDGKSRLQFPEYSTILEEFNNATAFWNTLSGYKLNSEKYTSVITELNDGGVLPNGIYTEWMDKEHPETAWGLLQDVTYNVTHKRDRMAYGPKLSMLAKTNSVFERNFFQ